MLHFHLPFFSHGWDFSGYRQVYGFRFLSESNKNGVEMNFEVDFFAMQDSNFNLVPPMFSVVFFPELHQSKNK